MNITVIFDMDGTIADLYAVEGWLEMLRAFDPTPYLAACPMVEGLAEAISFLRDNAITTKVVSWLSKESTPEYNAEVRKAKREWISEQGLDFGSIRLVPYGTEKAYYRDKDNINILIDDNADVRESFCRFPNCEAYDPAEMDMVKFLMGLVERA